MSKQPLSETIKAKLEEYEVERRLDELGTQAEHLVDQGRARAAELARDHRDEISRLVDRAADAVARRTDERHASWIDRVREHVERGVDKVAEQSPDADDPDVGEPEAP
jgi:F0F1-type ATP synthase membrane subunit b/b'